MKLYADETNESLVKELIRGEEYEYVPDGNFIVFREENVPPSEYFIVAQYDPLPDGARAIEEEESNEE